MSKKKNVRPNAPDAQQWPFRKRYLPNGREEIFMHPDISRGRIGLSPLRLGEQRKDSAEEREQ